MIPASATEDGETASRDADRAQRRIAVLARDLVDAVGVEGAIRYCSSLGWRGVLEEVELLRRQRAQAD